MVVWFDMRCDHVPYVEVGLANIGTLIGRLVEVSRTSQKNGNDRVPREYSMLCQLQYEITKEYGECIASIIC